jgi:hypothetical protein
MRRSRGAASRRARYAFRIRSLAISSTLFVARRAAPLNSRMGRRFPPFARRFASAIAFWYCGSQRSPAKIKTP